MPDQTEKVIWKEWKEVPGHDGKYFVSNSGDVLSMMGKIERKLKSVKCGNYKYLRLCRNGLKTTKAIHRLVLEVFVGPCPEGHEGCHVDGDPDNNLITNLMWGTRKQNCAHTILHGRTSRGDRHWTHIRPQDRPYGERHHGARFTEDQVKKIRESLTGKRGECAALAKQWNVPYGTMRNIVTGHRWKYLING